MTTALVLEYESVATRSLSALGLTPSDLGDLLDYLCRVGRRAAVRFRVRPSLPDPGDEFVIEAAVACGAESIVTHNVRHLAAGSVRFGIEAMTPGNRDAAQVGITHLSELRIELPLDVRAEVAQADQPAASTGRRSGVGGRCRPGATGLAGRAGVPGGPSRGGAGKRSSTCRQRCLRRTRRPGTRGSQPAEHL